MSMAGGRTIRRLLVAGVVVAAGGFAAMNPGVVKAFYRDIYPDDPARRQALELCFMQDHKFNRLDTGEREACYKRMLMLVGAVSSSDQGNTINPIDLERAAAQGSVPRNDIIRLQQNQNAQNQNAQNQNAQNQNALHSPH